VVVIDLIIAGGYTMIPISSPDSVKKIRAIFQRVSSNREALLTQVREEIRKATGDPNADIPDCISVDCQQNHWMDGPGRLV